MNTVNVKCRMKNCRYYDYNKCYALVVLLVLNCRAICTEMSSHNSPQYPCIVSVCVSPLCFHIVRYIMFVHKEVPAHSFWMSYENCLRSHFLSFASCCLFLSASGCCCFLL